MRALEGFGELGAKGHSRGIVFICLEEKVSEDIWFQDSKKQWECFYAFYDLTSYYPCTDHQAVTRVIVIPHYGAPQDYKQKCLGRMQGVGLCHDLVWVCLLQASILHASSASERDLI